MHDFNDRATGIFASGFTCAEGRPVRDTFAASLRAALFGRDGLQWGTERTAAFVAAFSSARLATLAADGAASWRKPGRPPPETGVYLLRDGRYARYASGVWYEPSMTRPAAADEARPAGFQSPAFRLQPEHRWIGPCVDAP